MILNNRGLTLIELLLSVLLIGIGLIAVIRPMLHSISAINHSANRVEIVRIFNAKLWEIQKNTQEKGVLDLPARGEWLGRKTVYHFAARANQTALDERLRDVKFRITWSEAGRSKSLEKAAYVSIPMPKK